MSMIRDKCVKLLEDCVYDPLIGRGFSPFRNVPSLGRWSGDRYEHFWFQCSYDKDFAVISSRVWVGFKSVAKFLKKGEVTRVYGIDDTAHPQCVGTYLRDLSDPRGPANWAVTPTTDFEALGDEIRDQWVDYGLPFLERFATLPAVIAHWKQERRDKRLHDSGEFQLAAALWLQGDKTDAITGLERLVEWRTFCLQDTASPGDQYYHRIATDVLQWFKGLA